MITTYKLFEQIFSNLYIIDQIESFDYKNLEELFKRYPEAVDYSWNDNTILSYAVLKDNKILFDLLIKYDVNINYHQDYMYKVFLKISINKNKKLFFLKKLIALDFDINYQILSNPVKRKSETLIVIASRLHHFDIVDYILKTTTIDWTKSLKAMGYIIFTNVKLVVLFLLNGYPMSHFYSLYENATNYTTRNRILKSNIEYSILEEPTLKTEFLKLEKRKKFNL